MTGIFGSSSDGGVIDILDTTANILALDPALNTGKIAFSSNELLELKSDGVNWFTTDINVKSSGITGFVAGDPTMTDTQLTLPDVSKFTKVTSGVNASLFVSSLVSAEVISNTDSRITAFSVDLPNNGDNKKVHLSNDMSGAYVVTDDKIAFDNVSSVHILDFFIENVAGVIQYAILPNDNIAIYPWLSSHDRENRRTLYNAKLSSFTPAFNGTVVDGEVQPDIGTFQVILEGINYTDVNNPNVSTVQRSTILEKSIVWNTNPNVGIIIDVGDEDGKQIIDFTEFWDTDALVGVGDFDTVPVNRFTTVLIFVDYFKDQFGDSKGIVYTVPFQSAGTSQVYTSASEAVNDLQAYRNRVSIPDSLRGTVEAFAIISKENVTPATITDPSVFTTVNLQTASGGGTSAPIAVIDDLVSTSTSDALSANQGRILDGKINTISGLSGALKTTSYLQASHVDPLGFVFPAANTPTPIPLNRNDEILGITHSETVDNSEITIQTTAVHFFVGAPQVSAGAAGRFRMFLQIDKGSGFLGSPNSNIELRLANNGSDVIVFFGVGLLEAGWKIRLMGVVTDTAVFLETIFPAGEETVPSIIFSIAAISSGVNIHSEVLGIVDSSIAPLTTNVNDSYALTNIVSINAAWGTITDLEEGDVVTYDGVNWVVSVNLSLNSTNAENQIWNTSDNSIYYFANGAWIRLVDSNNALGKFVDGTDPLDAVYLSGNVGIGTATPLNTLHVEGKLLVSNDFGSGSGTINAKINADSDDPSVVNPSSYVIFQKNKNTRFRIGTDTDLELGGNVGSPFTIRRHNDSGGNSGTPFTILRENGFIGIATGSPTSNLSVNGTADKVGGGSWAVFSDVRSKENVKTYERGLTEILELNPVTFNHKTEFDWGDKNYTGLLGHEVELVIPEMVSEIKVNDISDFKQVDTSELVFTLINAIKELNDRITVLEDGSS